MVYQRFAIGARVRTNMSVLLAHTDRGGEVATYFGALCDDVLFEARVAAERLPQRMELERAVISDARGAGRGTGQGQILEARPFSPAQRQ